MTAVTKRHPIRGGSAAKRGTIWLTECTESCAHEREIRFGHRAMKACVRILTLNDRVPQIGWPHHEIDWAQHSLGPMDAWPNALIYALGVIQYAAHPMMVTWGPERNIFYNNAYAPIVEGKPGAFGQPIAQVFAESWHTVRELFVRAEAGESVYLEDFYTPIFRRGSIEESWWTVSHSPIRTDSGEVGGVLCIVQDTSRVHVAEAQLRAVQAELTKVTDLVPSLLWKADSFGRTTWQNGRLRSLSKANGADPSNVWRKLVHPDDLPCVLVELNAAKVERRAFAKTVRLRVSATEYHWHQVRSEPSLNETGALVGWYGVATDVQETRDVQDVLDDRQALFGQFADNSSSLLWTVDLATFEVERLSRPIPGLWNPPEPPTRWTWSDFMESVHEIDRHLVKESFARVAAGEVVFGRFRIAGADGLFHVLEGTTFPIFNSEGRLTRVGGNLRDVTPTLRYVTHLIDGDLASQNRLSHGLRQAGHEVRTFDNIESFSKAAVSLKPGPVLYRHHHGNTELKRVAALMKSGLTGRPWIVIQDSGRPARDTIEVMKLGACDIVEADGAIGDVSAALTMAVTVITDGAAREAQASPIYRLTKREAEVLDGVVLGGTNKSIAAKLGLSPRTVETHRSHIMEKLGVSSLAELVALATSPTFRTAQP